VAVYEYSNLLRGNVNDYTFGFVIRKLSIEQTVYIILPELGF
jgi:hypothetical protein